MDAKHPEIHIRQEQLLAFVRTTLGGSAGREDDEHPLPPGPWDPVIRAALERMRPRPEPWDVYRPGVPMRTLKSVLGKPQPEPWKLAFASILAKHPEIFDVLGGGHIFEEAELNPQPLPPISAFLIALTQTVVSRAELFEEFARFQEGGEQGGKIASRYIGQFSDDICGNGIILRWPFPWPRPRWWFTNGLDGIDYLVLATQFDEAAKEAFNPALQQSLANASAQLVEAGMSKMQ